MKAFILPLLCALPGLSSTAPHGSVLLPAGSAVSMATDDEPMVFKVDERTKQPLGEVLKPRGVLLDPRDVPEPVLGYLSAAQGLQGLEASLTALFAKYIGFVQEAKKLGKAYKPFIETQRDNWNEQVRTFASLLDPKDVESMRFAAVYHDTGRRVNPDKNEIHVIGVPDIQLLPIEPDAFAKILAVETLLEEFGPDMSKERASELSDLLDPIKESVKDPWFDHGTFLVLMLRIGDWEAVDVESMGQAFKISGEEFVNRCRDAMKKGLKAPLIPEFPGNSTDGVLYFFEGLAAVRIAPTKSADKKDKTIWDAPKEFVAYNKSTQQPMLLIQVPEMPKYTEKSKYKQLEIATIAGGSKVTLYDGKFPFK